MPLTSSQWINGIQPQTVTLGQPLTWTTTSATFSLDEAMLANIQSAQTAQPILQNIVRPTTVKSMATVDVDNLQQFIDTGSSDLRVYIDDKNVLYLYGYNSLMATITSRNLKVHKKQGKHVLKQLTALAEREGLQIHIVDSLTERRGRPVGFWSWKVREEVDDSELVTVTQSRTDYRSPEAFYPDEPEEAYDDLDDTDVY